MKIVTLILVLGVLGALLMLQYRQWDQRIRAAQAQVAHFSNAWQAAWAKVAEREQVLAALETNLTTRTDDLVNATAQLVQTKSDLAQARAELARVRSELAGAQATLRATQEQLDAKTARLSGLEAAAEVLGLQMGQLTNTLDALENQIAEVQRKLARSEGNRDFLTRELKRLQQEKAALLARFNDLATLRAQLARLRAEAAINRRLTWLQEGIYQRRDMKGAEALVNPVQPHPKRGASLTVELDHTGNARVVAETNTPPAEP